MFLKTKEVKEILSLVPGVSADVVDVKSLSVNAFKTFVNSTKSSKYKDSFNGISAAIAGDYSLELVKKVSEPTELSVSNQERLVQLYFDQISFKTVHFDFRASHFSGGEKLFWKPSKFFYTFDETFLLGIRDLYKAYYTQNESAFEEALIKVGIIKETSSKLLKSEVVEVFLSHFAGASAAPLVFSFEKFQDSFAAIFELFKKHSIKIPNDFAYLGAYLASMYSTLDVYKTPINVSKLFKKSLIAK